MAIPTSPPTRVKGEIQAHRPYWTPAVLEDDPPAAVAVTAMPKAKGVRMLAISKVLAHEGDVFTGLTAEMTEGKGGAPRKLIPTRAITNGTSRAMKIAAKPVGKAVKSVTTMNISQMLLVSHTGPMARKRLSRCSRARGPEAKAVQMPPPKSAPPKSAYMTRPSGGRRPPDLKVNMPILLSCFELPFPPVAG